MELNLVEFEAQVNQMFEHVKQSCEKAVDVLKDEFEQTLVENVEMGYNLLGWQPISERYADWREQHGYDRYPQGHILDRDLVDSIMSTPIARIEEEIKASVYIQRLLGNYEVVQEFGGGGTWGYIPARPYFQPTINLYRDIYPEILAKEIEYAI